MALSTHKIPRVLGTLPETGTKIKYIFLTMITISQFPNTTSQMTAAIPSKEMSRVKFGVSMLGFSLHIAVILLLLLLTVVKLYEAFIICQALCNTLDLHYFV